MSEINNCLFNAGWQKCKALTSKPCYNDRWREDPAELVYQFERCPFYTDCTTHYIDKKSRYVGEIDIKTGKKLPVPKFRNV